MKIYTIGFTKKSANYFFNLLKKSGTKKIIDVRLNNSSQLARFSIKEDLEYYLKNLDGMNIDYRHYPSLLAPTKHMLSDYRNHHKNWQKYQEEFLNLLEQRQVEKKLTEDDLADGCLLCSEHKPHHCHRTLVANYLKKKWGDFEVIHLE